MKIPASPRKLYASQALRPNRQRPTRHPFPHSLLALASSSIVRSVFLPLLALAALLMSPRMAQAVPSYARQTGLQCTACHTEFPILTELGRQFKLGGYTLSGSDTQLPPIAFMLQPSFTETSKSQAGGAAPHFGNNSNLAVTQYSMFYSGRLFGPYAEHLFGSAAAEFLNKFGTFIQYTYDGVGRQVHWDNSEIRYADHGSIFGQNALYGFYTNNNPGMQDPWNSTPAFGFPFSGSTLVPTPSAGTLLSGALSQQVLGIGGYMMIGNNFYIDIAGYHSLGAGFQSAVGIDPTGETELAGISPYWRLAYAKTFGNNAFEVGLLGLEASAYPGQVQGAGTDHYLDFGLDTQFQTSFGANDVTFLGSWIHEQQHLSATHRLGESEKVSEGLWTGKATIDYLYDKTYGGAISYFVTDGSHDPVLYSGQSNGSPLSDGFIFQVDYLPFNKGGGPAFWPKSNVKISLQYIVYNHFNGGRSNDGTGAGRTASNDNSLYLEAWIAF